MKSRSDVLEGLGTYWFDASWERMLSFILVRLLVAHATLDLDSGIVKARTLPPLERGMSQASCKASMISFEVLGQAISLCRSC